MQIIRACFQSLDENLQLLDAFADQSSDFEHPAQAADRFSKQLKPTAFDSPHPRHTDVIHFTGQLSHGFLLCGALQVLFAVGNEFQEIFTVPVACRVTLRLVLIELRQCILADHLMKIIAPTLGPAYQRLGSER
jgi:hypothetical protein